MGFMVSTLIPDSLTPPLAVLAGSKSSLAALISAQAQAQTQARAKTPAPPAAPQQAGQPSQEPLRLPPVAWGQLPVLSEVRPGF